MRLINIVFKSHWLYINIYMAPYIYDIYKECDTLYELRDVCMMTMKETIYERAQECVR